MAVYIPDATKVTKIRLQLPTASFTKSTETLVSGWNFVRVRTEGGGSWSESADNTQIRVMAYHEAGAEETIYIGYFAQVKPAYGNMIIVADGPYYTFYTEAYPTLKEMGVPVVWALDPTQITESTAQDRQIINTSDLETLAMDGISEFSFHSYDMTLMSNATAEQALSDTLNNIRYLNKHGLQPRRIWRAAWLQNNCQHPDLANLELDASASYNGSAGVTEYPFIDRYNIPRYGVASRTTSQIDSIFSKLQNQHCTVVLYFHGISEGSDKEVTPEMLEYFIEKISTALTEGYLNPTTYNRLVSFYELI
jgi:peptidoglycan/xylan/chitin deacetylase (PgdA/CDA1 family)